MSKPMTLRRVRNIVKRMEADDVIGAEDRDIATLMVSALYVRANQRNLHRFTGLPTPLIRDVAARLRESGIWLRDGRTRCSWADDDATTTDFVLDLMVGKGLLGRKPA